MVMKKIALRSIRKTSHIGKRVLRRSASFAEKVENKADRIIGGSDFTIRLHDSVPLEKLYYHNQKWITPLNPALPSLGQKASIVLLIPTLDDRSFYGGTATALIVAGRIAEATGRPLSIVQTLKHGQSSGTSLSSLLAKEGIHISDTDIKIRSVSERSYNVYGYLPIHPDDVFIASAWWDAYLLQQLPLTRKFIYLVQDFEPIFYNNSDSYLLADSTYRQDSFIPLCNTRLMYDFMRERKYEAFTTASAQWFEPAVSREHSGKKKADTKDVKRRIFIYGRPDVHRNLFFTSLNAVDLCFKSGQLDKADWDIYMAGQSKVPDVQLSSGLTVRNLGKMKMEDYIDFCKTIDVAVSPMMAPHPNYPTLEFASVGAQVVTTRYANKTDLSHYSKNITMCDASIVSMSEAIALAATKKPVQSANNIPSDWSKTLQSSLESILAELKL